MTSLYLNIIFFCLEKDNLLLVERHFPPIAKTTTDLDFVPRIIVQHRNYTYFNDVVDTES